MTVKFRKGMRKPPCIVHFWSSWNNPPPLTTPEESSPIRAPLICNETKSRVAHFFKTRLGHRQIGDSRENTTDRQRKRNHDLQMKELVGIRLILFIYILWRHSFTMQPRIGWNSLCFPGWLASQSHRPASASSAEITGRRHHSCPCHLRWDYCYAYSTVIAHSSLW